MRLAGVLLVALVGLAQDRGPAGLLNGILIEMEGAAGKGELAVRAAANQVVRCGFDGKTYMERAGERIFSPELRAGDRLELVTDHGAGPSGCYARTVHVLAEPPKRPPVAWRRTYRAPTENIFPRGSLTFTGVVLRLDSESLLLRTRSDGQKRILLRSDTRYVDCGSEVEPAALSVATRVFIRAGKDLEGQFEAFQIVWGELPGPR